MGCFRDLMKEFEEADTQVLGISVDSFAAAGAFSKSLELNFSLLSDFPRHEAAKAYDVFVEERGIARRVTYVIDKEGVIRGVVQSDTDMEVHARESLAIAKQLAGKA